MQHLRHIIAPLKRDLRAHSPADHCPKNRPEQRDFRRPLLLLKRHNAMLPKVLFVLPIAAKHVHPAVAFSAMDPIEPLPPAASHFPNVDENIPGDKAAKRPPAAIPNLPPIS